MERTFEINGIEYNYATNLRVAYKVQAQNDHAPYAQVFQGIADMPVEKQIDILYASLVCGNKDFEKQYNSTQFRDICLDRMNIKELLDILKDIVQGIMGTDDEPDESSDENAKN